MNKRIATTLCLILLAMLCATPAPAQSGAADADQNSSAYDEALTFYRQGKYDDAIKLLAGPSAANQYDLKLNGLLARAMLGKCEKLKAAGDKSYRYQIKEPYVIGFRLLKANPSAPEPYYLIAKSLLINNRPYKASRTIEKAVYFAGPNHERYAKYMLTKGDCWAQLMRKGDRRGYGYARKSYEMALSAAKAKGDMEMTARLNARLEDLEKKN